MSAARSDLSWAERLWRALLGIALLPVAGALTLALADVLREAAANFGDPARPSPFWGLPVGFGLWLLIWALLPWPIRAYVLAHELTHAFWALLLGERVGAISVTRRGGSVRVSRRRFLALLAPYFFPLYTLLVLAAYGVAALLGDPSRYAVLWLAGIGWTWGFHFTFTLSMLAEDQSDIRQAGPLLAYVTIYAFNVAGIALWLAAVTPVGLRLPATRFAAHLRWLYETARSAW